MTQLAQQVMPHLSEARSSKTPFQFETVLSFVRQTAKNTVNGDNNDASMPWQGVTDYMAHVLQQANALLPLIMDAENTMKSMPFGDFTDAETDFSLSSVTGTPPWVVRVAEIKASAAVNVEAERKVVQLNDEIQALVRNLKTKEQNLQESSVKIELMDRRMEAAKKQADAIVDLESELSKARKQERSYEEAMEQLQADLDVLEQDNVKLKALAANSERQRTSFSLHF